MISDLYYETHELLSMCPAPGWRAVYIHYEPSEPGGESWTADPLIGWGIYQVTAHRTGDDADEGSPRGNEVYGVMLDGTYADRAPEAVNFWYYLGPGDPEPTPEEVAAEAGRRREAEARWYEHTCIVTAASYGLEYGRYRWLLRARPDGWRESLETRVVISEDDPIVAARMFGQLHALGIPVGDKYGGPDSPEGFWRQGLTPEQVATAMAGRRVKIGRRGDRGPWQVVPARPVPAAAA